MSLRFTHDTLPQRVIFDAARAADHTSAEVRRLGSHAAMLIASPSQSEIAARVTVDVNTAVVYDDVVPHVPMEHAERARAVATEHAVDLLISVGGGSTTGLAKAVALTTGLPILAVPTTYAGSEATPVWGLTEHNRKTTGVNVQVLPTTFVYDAELTRSLPVCLSVASGLNALAHCVDALWAPKANPINAAFATEGIATLASALPSVIANPQDLAARQQALYGAYLSAVSFALAGSGMHHKICHVLGGTFEMPHAQTHAILLPYVLAFNAPAAPEAAQRIAWALGTNDPVHGIEQLYRRLNAPTALQDLGLDLDNLDQATDLALPAVPASNPRPPDRAELRHLLHTAWAGSQLAPHSSTPIHP